MQFVACYFLYQFYWYLASIVMLKFLWNFSFRFHKEVHFNINLCSIEEAQFKLRTFGHTVMHAYVTFDSLSTTCVAEFLNLTERLVRNKNLASISIEPSHSHIQYHKWVPML